MIYVRYALFKNLGEARAALEDVSVEADELSKGRALFVLHESPAPETVRSSETDASHGLVVGFLSGAAAGLLLGLLLAATGILPVSLPEAAAVGLFLGALFGTIGGGLYGVGLRANSLAKLEGLWKNGNVLVTAEVNGAEQTAQVEHIFKRHHAQVVCG
jgi:hypothetical protein